MQTPISAERTAARTSLHREKPWLPYAETLLLIGLVGWLDFATGSEVSVAIFYLAPVSLLAWYTTVPAVVIGSLLCSVAWVVADLLAGHVYSHAAMPYWNGTVRLGFFLLCGLALVRIRTLQARESSLARTDPLTGLLNRRAFYEVLEAEMRRVRRTDHPLSIGLFDLDDFKQVNDGSGHHAGDDLLRTVASALARTYRATDALGRLGGDEFVVLLPETNSEQAAHAVARFREELRTAMSARNWSVTASFGSLTCYEPPDEATELMRAVDRLMYAAKEQGKDRVVQGCIGASTECGSKDVRADSPSNLMPRTGKIEAPDT